VASDLVLWTIRLALASYSASLGFALVTSRASSASAQQTRCRAAARLFWTVGCLAYLAHVAAAFRCEHGWSHARAYEHTAERTWELTGWDWGGGLYVNYLFTLLWAADAVWWWAGAASYRARRAWIGAALHAFMLFVAFNATVVFGAGVIRWCGLAVALVLAAAWWRWRAARRPEEDRSAREATSADRP
jgi:hypothetical protein